jgi:L-threonylcarbamoyladenylate synthase
MKILKINPSNPDRNIIKYTAQILANGGVIVYPTDTCYGIGADITNKHSFYKVYDIKKRPHNKPFSVIVKDTVQIQKLAIINDYQKKYIAKYYPGQITFVFLTLDYKTFPFSSIGIRIPNYKITQMISEIFSDPYITTSANISNYPITYDVKDLLNQLKHENILPDLILDAGKLPKNDPSTVVDLTKSSIRIIRQGGIKIKKL